MHTIKKNQPNYPTIFEQFDAMSEYDIIAGMELLDIHIRGSDSKDNIIKNNRLIIFILMKGFVMSYVQGQNKEEGIPIKFVCLTDSVQFQKLNATTLILDKKVDNDVGKTGSCTLSLAKTKLLSGRLAGFLSLFSGRSCLFRQKLGGLSNQ